MAAITKSDYARTRGTKKEKRSHFWLHVQLDLCIISVRPPPRWAKWSRGVRTRGLRVGLVGGPRPLLFLGRLQSRYSRSIPNNQRYDAHWTFIRVVLIYASTTPERFVQTDN